MENKNIIKLKLIDKEENLYTILYSDKTSETKKLTSYEILMYKKEIKENKINHLLSSCNGCHNQCYGKGCYSFSPKNKIKKYKTFLSNWCGDDKRGYIINVMSCYQRDGYWKREIKKGE